ncbi:response regulator transcription factor [Paenibacillus piri]|uniref:Response regulator n=1 Tax=Paenibacillus piri TaxID=2547395 RepID=A0A4R5KX90_9BACL|nr:response regulator [Paenibacillus piri]TDF99667.1 response regulator [Paenibacillus piri]
MKMVIADDENLVRVSLKSMIKDMETSWQIVGEATNGEELLAMVAEHEPNIVIADIRMPKLNGLEAIRLGRTISPLTNWVILSGFSDFTYAQQALKLGVSEYLLKPVDPVELEKTLNHIYKDNKEYITLLNQQFENNLFALCHGLTSLKHEERSSMLYQGKFIGWTFHIDSVLPANGDSDIQQQFYKELRACMENELVCGMNLALLALANGELAAVGAWDPVRCQEAKRRVADFFGKLEPIIGRYRSAETTLTIMQTGECQGFEAVNCRLQQLQQWSDLRAVCGIGRSLEYTELKNEAALANKAEAARLLCAIGQYLRDGMYLNYHNTVNELEALLQKSELFAAETTRESIRLYVTRALGLNLPDSRLVPGAQTLPEQERTTEPLTVHRLIQELRQYGEQVLREKSAKESAPVDLVKEVIHYMEQHYMDDIGIGQIAGVLNVSANYLSGLFHKKTGVMFVKYLTRIRMLKAKELLMNTNLQVRQVAEQVGYYSTRHFTKLFTQTFGYYPSDYRKNQLQSGF